MLDKIQKNLGYEYKNTALLKNALTHSSYANENHVAAGSNERLEFLGDSVLSVIVSDYIYKHFSHLPEGELTKIRASLVCEKSLCEFSKELGIGDSLFLSKGENNTGGRHRPSILADAFEAVLASIYLDGGIEPARELVLRFIVPELKNHKSAQSRDYKTLLQEVIQQNPEERLSYVLVGESGPDHDKHFTAEVHINSNVVSSGEGSSKKDAEQSAAKKALKLMGLI